MKIQESNLSTTASVPLDCEEECGKTSAPPGRAEKKQKTSHEVKATSQLPCNLGEEHIYYTDFSTNFSLLLFLLIQRQRCFPPPHATWSSSLNT